MHATIGVGNALDGFEAGTRAARQALRELGRARPALGILISAHAYPMDQVVAGASAALGETPLWGFGTSAELHSQGQNQHSVLIALLSAENLEARAAWWPGFIEDSRACTAEMLKALQPEAHLGGALLLVAEGLNGDAADLCAAMPQGNYVMAGALAGGDLHSGHTYQVGGHQAGSGGLAAVIVEGLSLGIGAAHGWNPVGAYARITQSQGLWLRSLDDRPSAETYARFFGFPTREWAFPPLNELVRAYPLGLEAQDQDAHSPLIIRSPLRFEADGSLRMSTHLPQEILAHLLVASPDRCLEAAKQAAQQALENLDGVHPALALVLVDAAWQTILEAQPGSEVTALQAVLGAELPIIGGYTYGQITRLASQSTPDLLNNHILVVLFGSHD